jgi:hypothetical protein
MRATLDYLPSQRYTVRTMSKQEFSGDLVRAIAVVLYEENERKQSNSEIACFSRETPTTDHHRRRHADRVSYRLGHRVVYGSTSGSANRSTANNLPDLLA